MAISWGAIQEVIRSSATTNVWSGDVTATESDSTIAVVVEGGTNLSTDSPGIVTLTIGGVDVTVELIGGGGTNVRPWVAIGYLHNVPAGTHTLSLQTANNNRWMQVHAVEFFELDQSDTVGASGQLGGTGTQTTASFTDTTTIDGSVHLSGVMIETPMEGALSATGGATLLVQRQTGANSSSDGTGGVAIELVATAGLDGHGISWSSAQRRGYAWVRLNPATGGASGSGSATASLVLASTVTGVALVTAAALGGLVLSSSAAGSAAVQAAGSANLVISSSAAGAATVTGEAVGQIILSSSVTGSVDVQAVADVGLVIASAVAGVAPIEAAAAAALVLGSSATADVGDLDSSGSASIGLVITSSASGVVIVAGAAAGQLVLASSAAGAANIDAAVSGSLVLETSAVAVSPIAGSASIGLVLGSSVFGGVTIIGGAAAGIVLGATATASVANAPTIDHIILAGFRRPGYRTPGGQPSSQAPGGQGRARTVGGGA